MRPSCQDVFLHLLIVDPTSKRLSKGAVKKITYFDIKTYYRPSVNESHSSSRDVM
jgi:hypothetical protein